MQNTSSQKSLEMSITIFIFKAIDYCNLKNLINALKHMNLTLLILFQHNFLLAWEAALRKVKVKLVLLTNINMLLMVKKVQKVEYVTLFIDTQKITVNEWKIIIQKRIVKSYATLKNMVESKSKCFTNISVFFWDHGRKTWSMWSWYPERDTNKSFFIFHHSM